jgi:hypothetical protein
MTSEVCMLQKATTAITKYRQAKCNGQPGTELFQAWVPNSRDVSHQKVSNDARSTEGHVEGQRRGRVS